MNNSKTIVFIHGMFMNNFLWGNWITFFQSNGFICYAPPWPFHAGIPAELRNKIPAKLASLELKTIVGDVENFIFSLSEKPILIGYLMGGLIAQILINKGIG